ncbi:hypothetical protein DRJ17_02860 [Candidatus Woesearchaeota archaeon]|nr:MAG: hypothetical protein DRJ17_02860 [Candidatus Woesearchaeota archaeon]
MALSKKAVFFSLVAIFIVALLIIAFLAMQASQPYATEVPVLKTKVASLNNLIANMKDYTATVTRMCAFKSFNTIAYTQFKNESQMLYFAKSNISKCIGNYETKLSEFRIPLGVEVNFEILKNKLYVDLNNSMSVKIDVEVNYSLDSSDIKYEPRHVNITTYMSIFGIKDPMFVMNGITDRTFSNHLGGEFYVDHEGFVINKNLNVKVADSVREGFIDDMKANGTYSFSGYGPNFFERFYFNKWVSEGMKGSYYGLFSYVNDEEDFTHFGSCENEGETRSCGSDIGECSKGTQTCSGGKWSKCEGAVVPVAEVCDDGKDNDCDESTDCGDSDCSSFCIACECSGTECRIPYDGQRCDGCHWVAAPTEICIGNIDEDCDGDVDCDDPDCTGDAACAVICQDSDGDGYGLGCALGNDCDDSVTSCNVDCVTLAYEDADGDNYGNPDASNRACDAPAGYIDDNTDCDDNTAAVNPGVAEICDNYIDDDCDGAIDCADQDCADKVPCKDMHGENCQTDVECGSDPQGQSYSCIGGVCLLCTYYFCNYVNPEEAQSISGYDDNYLYYGISRVLPDGSLLQLSDLAAGLNVKTVDGWTDHTYTVNEYQDYLYIRIEKTDPVAGTFLCKENFEGYYFRKCE